MAPINEGLHIYTPSAPKKGSGGGEYRRPVNVWVVMAPSPPNTIKDRQILARVSIAENVDSRYSGPKSSYGKAISEAEDVARDIHSFLTKGLGLKAGRDEYRKYLHIYLHQCLGVDRRYKKYKQVMADVAARRMQS